MTKKLHQKVALVTGASKGIGASIARHLAAEGASIVVNYSGSRADAERVVAEITARDGRAVAIQADVSKPEDIRRLFAETKSAFGRLDILVNNAGIYLAAPFGEITVENYRRQFDLNVLGLCLCTQESMSYFGPEGGAIVNTSSIVVQLSPVGMAIYSATKSAVDNITRTSAKELAERKIRVNSVNPGRIATEGLHAAGFDGDGAAERAVLGPMGRPDDVAPAVVFLASDDARWITGQALYVTGSA